MKDKSKRVAWTGYFKTDKKGEVSLRHDDIFTLKKHLNLKSCNYQIFIIDWHTISLDNPITAYDLVSEKMCKINLRSVDLVHFLKLGYGSRKTLTLKEKWNEFSKKLEILEKCKIKTVNPIETVRYGLSKKYLVDLQAKGISIPVTKMLPSNISYEEFTQLDLRPTDIIKPANGECGHFVMHRKHINQFIYDQYAAQCDEILIQEFVPEIKEGEKSLIFCQGNFLFAVKKIPAPNHFKSNNTYVGAQIEPYTPTEKELIFCLYIIECYERPLSICRLDIISTSSTIFLMELEVVDPGYYTGSKAILSESFLKLYASILGE
jgi:glutathione synthase/RimK-type ligase-like ATP-grasp enzyme